MLNIKIELNIKSHDYYKFITNDMNNEKIRVYQKRKSKIFASFLLCGGYVINRLGRNMMQGNL